MLESIKIKIDATELKSLLTEYYKNLYNDDSVMVEYQSKFRYVDSYSSVEPDVWGVLSRNINGKIDQQGINLWNSSLSAEIFDLFQFEHLQWHLEIECDMKTPGKKDSERIIFKGIIIEFNKKVKQKIK